MSVQAIGWVFSSSPATGVDRLVLLSIANHAGQTVRDGAWEAWPAIGTIAAEAGIRRQRTVQESIARLEAAGQIVRLINGAPDERIRADRRPNLFRIVTDAGVTVGVIPLETDEVPDNVIPLEADEVPENVIPLPIDGVTVDAERGAVSRQNGVPPVGTQTVTKPSLEPSLEPSGEPSRAGARPAATEEDVRKITTTWTNATGMTITAMQWDQFADWIQRYGEEWVVGAIHAAGDANARSLSYVRAVLETWHRKGRPTGEEDKRDGRNGNHPTGPTLSPGELAALR